MTRLRSHATLTRMLKDLGISGDPNQVRRTYSGHVQRSVGAWSWSVDIASSYSSVGSRFPLSEVLRAHKERRVVASVLNDCDIELFVEESTAETDRARRRNDD